MNKLASDLLRHKAVFPKQINGKFKSGKFFEYLLYFKLVLTVLICQYYVCNASL